MNLNSRLFDRIRIAADEPAKTGKPNELGCEHPGCKAVGEFRAPKGRGHDGQYFRFCLDHVKAYNATYNYFQGMTDDAVASFQKDAIIGHRPTWKLGVNAQAARKGERNGKARPRKDDPFNFFQEAAEAARPKKEEVKIGNAARSALTLLDLEPGADKATVKARYKELVKRLHPDANGGDRSREERLAEIIKAYAYLKTIGRV